MSSSMLAGERRWASARRGGMTVLGKVAVPKPINLPSQKLENHGLDPNVEIVPKGSLSWGSRPSSSTSNPWGSSSVSPNADGNTVSPRHPSGRPSSGGGLSRPSTAGSDRLEPSAPTWGPSSRPSSASGVLTSNQSSLTSSRPLSSETRPGSSHLSRFAEPVYDSSGARGSNVTSDKLSIPSKANNFSLSSGDFPTLGSEKDNSGKSSEALDHGSHVRPGSGSGRTAPVKDRNEMAQADHKSGTVDTWTRDGSLHIEEMGRPGADTWQGDPQQYINPNMPPQHFDTWRGPPINAPTGTVWYRGPPYPPVPHGGFPMEPFSYYRPPAPPNLPNLQSGPPPGPGPRGHHPRNDDFYRPQMPDAFIRPGMPIRPGFYPGPGPYDSYYGPPMGYNMPPGSHGPPVYNMGPPGLPQNPSEIHDPHFRGGVRGTVGNMFVLEQLDSFRPEEPRGPYKVLRKRENEKDADVDEESWEQNLGRTSFHKNERGTVETRRNEEGTHKNKLPFPEASNDILPNQKDTSLIQKIEGLNAKVRASDVQGDPERKNRLLVNPKDNPTTDFGTVSDTRDVNTSKSRQSHNKERLNNQDIKNTGESLTSTVDPADGQAQRARTRELLKQRAMQLQKEEEERIKEQKAKALAKLEELNKRTLAAADEKTTTSVPEQEDVNESEKPTGPAIDDSKHDPPCSDLDEKGQQKPVDPFLLPKQSVANVNDAESKVVLVGNDVSLQRQKRVVHRQKQVVQMTESSVDQSTVTGTVPVGQPTVTGTVPVIKIPVSNVTVSVESIPNQENNSNIISESTQQRKKNNKSSKNKHKIDDYEKPEPCQNDLVSSTVLVTSAPDTVTNQYKPQHSRKMPRNPQANKTVDRFHVGDIAVWAPVRPVKTVQDDVASNLESKRAEMERYVPKPVAKELSQQGSININVNKSTSPVNVGPTVESKSVDNKQNKQPKPQQTDLHRKSVSQRELPNPVPTETHVTHEWDPSDGWFMPDEYPPAPVTSVVKDEGGVNNKGKNPAFKGPKPTMKTHNAEVELEQTVRPVSSKENRGSSHWQPKPQSCRGGGQTGQTARTEVKPVRPKEPVTEYKSDRQLTSFRQQQRPYSPLEDEGSFEPHHGSTTGGFRKYGGQNNRPGSGGQDDRRKTNQYNNANINRERQKQNLHYEYQPVGSNNNNGSNNKSGNIDASVVDGSGNAGPRYKERGSGSGQGQSQSQPRRGGGNFYGRQ